MKASFALPVVGLLLVATMVVATAASMTNRVSVSYVVPTNPSHHRIYEDLKEHRALEKLQQLLSPVRLPRSLEIAVAGCDGEADAFYGDDAITICYEYLDYLWRNKPSQTTAAGVAPIVAVIGPFVVTSLHDFGHALFDMLDLPVFGREEDAADQVAAYIYLQLGESEARRLIMGTAYAYFAEAKKGDAPQSREEFAGAFADEHGLPAQRAYNVLCIAYGADSRLFKDVVTGGYLPKERAEVCEDEYEQVQDAFEKLVAPHIDSALAEKNMDRTWLRKEPKEGRTGSPQVRQKQ